MDDIFIRLELTILRSSDLQNVQKRFTISQHFHKNGPHLVRIYYVCHNLKLLGQAYVCPTLSFERKCIRISYGTGAELLEVFDP